MSNLSRYQYEFFKQNKYVKYKIDNLNSKLGKFTFGLDKVIPWEESNFILSGGLLYDVLTDNLSNELMDIDLFFYGSIESKEEALNKLLINLEQNQYNYLIGYIKSVIYIFVQGIPRIIQVIMTDKKSPEEITCTFDLTHVQMYYQNNNVWGTELAKLQLESKTTELTQTHYVPYRLIKYFEKGMNIGDKIFKKNNFISSGLTLEYIAKWKAQKKIYSITNNLTIYPDGTQIDYANWDRTKLDLGVVYFDKCKIYYTKPINQDLLLEVNVVGNFLNYFKNNGVIMKKILFNDDEDDKYIWNNSRWLENSNYTYEQVKDDEIRYFAMDSHSPENSLSKIISCYELNCFYLPCEFIKNEEFYYNGKRDKNYEVIIKKGTRVYFKLKDKEIIAKLLQIINYDKIKSAIDVNCELYENGNPKRVKSIRLKNLLNKNNWDNKISLPFENTSVYPAANKYSHTTEFNNIEDGLIIKTNIYQMDSFNWHNGFNIFEKLIEGQKVYCMFKYFTYINCVNTYPFDVNLIDVNLQLAHIYGPEH